MLGFPASGRGQGCVEPQVHCVHPDSGSCYKFPMGPRTHSSSEGRLHTHRFLVTSTAGHISVSWTAPSVCVPALLLVPRTPSSQLQVVLAEDRRREHRL